MSALSCVRMAERRDARVLRPPVVRTETPSTETPVLYRAIALGEAITPDAVAGLDISQPADPEEKEADRIAETAMRAADPTTLPPLRPSGQTTTGAKELDPTDRAFFERRFGMDLGGIRVHADTTAATNAGRLSANAFPIGSDISFASGPYKPG